MYDVEHDVSTSLILYCMLKARGQCVAEQNPASPAAVLTNSLTSTALLLQKTHQLKMPT